MLRSGIGRGSARLQPIRRPDAVGLDGLIERSGEVRGVLPAAVADDVRADRSAQFSCVGVEGDIGCVDFVVGSPGFEEQGCVGVERVAAHCRAGRARQLGFDAGVERDGIVAGLCGLVVVCERQEVLGDVGRRIAGKRVVGELARERDDGEVEAAEVRAAAGSRQARHAEAADLVRLVLVAAELLAVVRLVGRRARLHHAERHGRPWEGVAVVIVATRVVALIHPGSDELVDGIEGRQRRVLAAIAAGAVVTTDAAASAPITPAATAMRPRRRTGSGEGIGKSPRGRGETGVRADDCQNLEPRDPTRPS